MKTARHLLPKFAAGDKPKGLPPFRAPKSAMERWDKTILAAKNDSDVAEIAIMGEIGDENYGLISANSIKAQLKAIGKAPVMVMLNSPGGDFFEGVAIYNLLREHSAKVTVRVLGLAASAASLIAMAGDTVQMGEAAMMMIHSAWGIVVGNRNDLREFAVMLDAIDTSAAELYARRSGMSIEDVLKMMEKETWLSASESVKNGFADELLSEKKDKKKYASASAVAASAAQSTAARLAASGDRSRSVVMLSASVPGASGNLNQPKGKQMKTTAERIADFEAKRAASAARMAAIMDKASEEGRSLDETEEGEYDGLEAEISATDAHLVRLKKHEAIMVKSATAVTVTTAADPAAAAAARGGERPFITVGDRLDPGIKFTRYVKALALAKGNLPGALAIAQHNREWMDTSPEVAKVLMAAVAGGDTTTAGWASELVYNQNLVNEFIAFLRPKTVIGRVPGLTPVPFNVRVSGQSSGSAANWVGQGKPVPVSKLGTLAVTLGIAKAAGLVVLTKELIQSSQPSAELVVRNDLTAAIAQFLDQQFLSPDFAAVANVSPASMTSGVNPLAPTGTTSAALRTDVQTLFNTWITANLDPSGGVWIMPPTTALAISLMLNALGQPVFPTINMNGGTFFGLPVITSMSAVMVGSPVPGEGNMIILLNAPEVMIADEGQVTIDASAEASIEMLDNPTNQSGGAGPTATSMVSMFQTNAVALRATRFINWAKKRAIACAYIKDAAYVT